MMNRLTEKLSESEKRRFYEIKNIFTDCLLMKDGLETIIRKASDQFLCPVILTTSTYRVLVLEDRGMPVEDPVWKLAEETGYCGAESVALFESEGVTRQVLESEGAFVLDQGLANELPRMLQKIRVFGKVGAYIGIFETARKFTQLDLAVCDLLCEILTVFFERDPSLLQLDSTIKDSILTDLVSGELQSATVLNDRLRSAGWKTFSHFQCILITPERTNTGIDNADYLSAAFKRNIAAANVIRVPEGLLLLLNFEKSPMERYRQKLTGTAEKYSLFMNASGVFDDLISLRAYYQLCIRVRRTAKRLQRPERLMFFEDLVFSVLAEELDGPERLTYMQNEYRVLSAYDSSHETEYCETLAVYIACACNVTEAAEKLFVHRNTLTRRLARIQEICGIDLGDGNSLIHFYFSAKMAQHA